MNLHYRIVKVDPASHGVLIRYWTDIVTEMDLAGPRNPDGTPQLNADGYPLATQTDVFMSLYDTPTPSPEELDARIKMQAPVDWLRLQENIKDNNVDTSMDNIRPLTGEEVSFTDTDVANLRQAFTSNLANSVANTAVSAQDALVKAYQIVGSLNDAITLLEQSDPGTVTQLANTISTIIHV
jgi:hypothetical protein